MRRYSRLVAFIMGIFNRNTLPLAVTFLRSKHSLNVKYLFLFLHCSSFKTLCLTKQETEELRTTKQKGKENDGKESYGGEDGENEEEKKVL